MAREFGRKLTNLFEDKLMEVTVDFDVEQGASADQTTLTHTIIITTKGIGKLFTPVIKKTLPGQTVAAVSELKKLAESQR